MILGGMLGDLLFESFIRDSLKLHGVMTVNNTTLTTPTIFNINTTCTQILMSQNININVDISVV